MRLIAGLVHWEPVAADAVTAAIGSMAARGSLASEGTITADNSVGMLAGGLTERPETVGPIWVVADADLASTDDAAVSTGAGGSAGERLIALYQRFGPDFVRRLRGAFAVALWDGRTRTLLLAADPMGIKRVYYVTDSRRTAFASRSSALLGAPGVAGAVDPAGVYNYLNFGYLPAPQSIFAGVARVSPGTMVLVRDGHPTSSAYWTPRWTSEPMRAADAAAAVRTLVSAAVGRALEGATAKTAGAFLSGGTDSSTVVGLMTRITGERVNAFSIGFRETPYDELAYARLVARHFDVAHDSRLVSADDTIGLLPRLAAAYDEPFGNNSAIGTFFCADLARECGTTLLLAGDGGDEIFAGNERYQTDRIFARYHRLPAVVRRGLVEPVMAALPADAPGLFGRAQRYVRRANIPNPRRFYSWQFYFAREADDLLTGDFQGAIQRDAPYRLVESVYAQAAGTAELNRLLHLDLTFTIGDNDMFKVTRTAELAGVQVRFPLLDLSLVDFMNRVPADLKMRGTEKRYLFKRAFGSLLPREVLRKRKHGFGVPTSVWLRDHERFRSLVRDTLLSARARGRGYLRPAAIERLFAAHDADSTPYYGEFLWSLFMLELWHRHHVDADGPAS